MLNYLNVSQRTVGTFTDIKKARRYYCHSLTLGQHDGIIVFIKHKCEYFKLDARHINMFNVHIIKTTNFPNVGLACNQCMLWNRSLATRCVSILQQFERAVDA